MEITKYDLKILRYIYSRRTVSFKRLKKHFKSNSDISEIIQGMRLNDYITVVSGIDKPTLARDIPDSCVFALSGKGAAEVEKSQWLNWEFFVKELLAPIIVAIIVSIITTIITVYMTGAVPPQCQ